VSLCDGEVNFLRQWSIQSCQLDRAFIVIHCCHLVVLWNAHFVTVDTKVTPTDKECPALLN
jgi:hypothetical protein